MVTKKDIINQLRSIPPPDRETQRCLIRRLMSGLVKRTVPFCFPKLFRARKITDRRLFFKIGELWYPPPTKVCSYGRVHVPGKPMFYAGENEHTALKETTMDGDVAICLEIKLKSDYRSPRLFAAGRDRILQQRGIGPEPDSNFENEGEASEYCNYISQTMNILKPKHKLFCIYPVFHFFPGEPQDRRAWRKDGKMHWLTTPPNSENADRMLEAALATEDLYRIGIACHAFADSWAHQNVTGYYEEYKAIIENLLDKILKKQLLIHIAKRVG